MRWAIAALAIVASASSASAQFLTLGPGNDTCGRWVRSEGNRDDRQFLGAWLTGFLSGANAASTQKAGAGVPYADMALAMDAYCRAHPLDTISTAAQDLWADLIERQRRAK